MRRKEEKMPVFLLVCDSESETSISNPRLNQISLSSRPRLAMLETESMSIIRSGNQVVFSGNYDYPTYLISLVPN